jgi:hypothetical protein
MTVTNKRYSYPRVTVIWIDVHPTGENLINTLHTFHAQFAYDPRPYISCGLRRQLFASLHEDETCPYTRKKSWWPKTDRLTQSSSRATSFFLPYDGPRVGERGFGQVVTQLYQLTDPYHQHAIGTFNTCSRGSTHRSLTNTGGGYNLEVASFPYFTSRPSQPMVLPFPPTGPARSAV